MKYYYFVVRNNLGNIEALIGKFKNKSEILINQYPNIVLSIIEITKKEYINTYKNIEEIKKNRKL